MRLMRMSLFLLFVLLGCTDALPHRSSDSQISDSLQLAESAAAKAELSAKQAAEDRERAEQLLAEVKSYGLRSDDAGAKCGDAIRRIGEIKAKAQREFRISRSVKAKASSDAASNKAGAKAGNPDYSPSDAP